VVSGPNATNVLRDVSGDSSCGLSGFSPVVRPYDDSFISVIAHSPSSLLDHGLLDHDPSAFIVR